MKSSNRKRLSPLEYQVMKVLWRRRAGSAEEVREELASSHPLKESTVRTILRRIESKGYVSHQVQGRTYIYEPLVQAEDEAIGTVRQVIDRFLGGSVERLLVGMVDAEMVDPAELIRLAERIEAEPEEDGE